MLNAHFLYLLGHIRLLEEQYSVTSLNRAGIGLIGTAHYNQLYMHAIKCSAHHSRLISICQLDFPQTSATYFMRQKQKIEEIINNDDVDSIIMTAVCSDELLKFAIHTSVIAGKDILLNDIPNYSEKEFNALLKQAKQNDVLIEYQQPLSFDSQFNQIKMSLITNRPSETGLLRISTHRTIEAENQLIFKILRNILTNNIALLLTLFPDFSLSAPSIQYSHPLTKLVNGDVLIINLRHKSGLLVSFEMFFNTARLEDKLSLKQCGHRYEIENQFSLNKKTQSPHQNKIVLNQLDQFILKRGRHTELSQSRHWGRTNELVDEILKQLGNAGFI